MEIKETHGNIEEESIYYYSMTKTVLGISAYYHDSAAPSIIKDGRICAAAQEERFSRIKHDSSFPRNAVDYVLRETGTIPSVNSP